MLQAVLKLVKKEREFLGLLFRESIRDKILPNIFCGLLKSQGMNAAGESVEPLPV
jgi:hypothetical protein